MEIIKPSVELWSDLDVTREQHIARCARVCYGHKGEGKDPVRLVDTLVKSGHVSMLRHASRYLFYENVAPDSTPDWFEVCPYNQVYHSDRNIYISTNEQEYRYSEYFIYDFPAKSYTSKEFLQLCKTKPELFDLFRLTFSCVTSIMVSRELNRKSPNNIAERSTRYCASRNGITICQPHWWNEEHNQAIAFASAYPEQEAMLAWTDAEEHYKNLLDLGQAPEDARTALPLETATQVVYTYSVAEWKHIIDLRYYEKTGKAYPGAKLICGMIRDWINVFAKVNEIIYEV